MQPHFDLSGRRALITGASGGFGGYFAHLLATQGADIVLAARRVEKLEALARDLEKYKVNVTVTPMDVGSAESVTSAFKSLSDGAQSPCDIIINNAGIGQDNWLLDIEDDEWSNVVNTNLNSVWRVSKAAVLALKAHNKGGSIVNISSITGIRPTLKIAAYAASKAGVEHLTRTMALELARSKIRVNSIAPGYFITPLNEDFLESEAGDKLRQRIPAKRFGAFEDLGGPLLLLVSDAGAYINGTCLVVDGGHSLSPL